MAFCPKCRAEYREGINRCEECDLDLVDKVTTENSVYDISEAKMVELRVFMVAAEAEMIQEMLEQHEIRSLLQGEAASGGLFPTPATPIYLLVDERDLEKAQEILDAYLETEVPVEEGADIVVENKQEP